MDNICIKMLYIIIQNIYNLLKLICPSMVKKTIKIILELKLFGIQLHRPIGMYFFS